MTTTKNSSRHLRRQNKQNNWKLLPILRTSSGQSVSSHTAFFYTNEDGEKLATHPFVNTKFTSNLETITASLAKHILDNFNVNNRRSQPVKVKGFLHAMQQDQWRATNQGLGFSKDTGMLQDGQHRLEALLRHGYLNNPDDLSATSMPMLVVSGLDPEVQQVVDKGTNRSLSDTAEISGVLGATDKEGRLALSLVNAHCTKTTSGNGRSSHLATHQDVLDKFGSAFGDTGETFEDVARRFVSYQSNSLYDINLGHLAAFFDYAFHHPEKGEEALRLATANTDDTARLSLLNEDSDELSAIVLFRELLKQEASFKRKTRISHNGAAFSEFYTKALFTIQHFHNEQRVKKTIGKRNLRTKSEMKGNTSKYNFHWGMLKA